MTATEERPATEVGNARLRKEDARLITGRTRWTDNIVLPGLQHIAMVRSPFAHARITAIDTEAAKAASRRSPARPGRPRRTSWRRRSASAWAAGPAPARP
jgi:hypothetical protein